MLGLISLIYKVLPLSQKTITVCIVLLSLYKGISHQNYFRAQRYGEISTATNFCGEKSNKNE
jgi:hypothetical protein